MFYLVIMGLIIFGIIKISKKYSKVIFGIAVMLVFFYLGYKFGFIVSIVGIIGGVSILLGINHLLEVSSKKLKIEWIEKGYDEMLDVENEMEKFENLVTNDFTFNHFNIPLGRAMGFMGDFAEEDGLDISDIDYLGFSPVRSKVKEELREYGILLTNRGLFIKIQEIDESDKNKTNYKSKNYWLKFSGLYAINLYGKDENKALKAEFYEGDNIKLQINKMPEITQNLVNQISSMIEIGITRNFYYEELAMQTMGIED